MIRSIALENFQSHEDTVLNLHPGVNAIVGSSDSGKTAILRALYWVIYNRPLGDAFVSHWNRTKKGVIKEDGTATVIEIDGIYIRRERTEKFNGYRLIGLEEKTLEAIRAEVPEEITRALQMTEVNIQRQMDAPFLLSDSPPEVARFFNRTIRLDLIDSLLTAAESLRRGIQRDQKLVKSSLEDFITQIEKFDWVEAAERLVRKANNVTARLADEKTRHTDLHETFIDHGQLQTAAHSLGKGLDKASTFMMDTETIARRLQETKARNLRLSSLHEQYEENQSILAPLSKLPTIEKLIKETERLERRIEEQDVAQNDLNLLILEHLSSTQILKRFTELPEIITKTQEIETIQQRLRPMRAKRSGFRADLEQREGLQQTIDVETETIEALIDSLPDICPTCGAPLDKDHLLHV